MRKANTRIVIGAVAALWATQACGAADGAALYRAKACHGCHGERPNRPMLPVYPKLSGQNAPYLLQQMKDIRDGKRTNGFSAAMKAAVGNVADTELEAIANWLATQ